MSSLTIYARAKINITLDVTAKRADGYHDLRMIMQTVELADKINIDIGGSGDITVGTTLKYLPSDQRNIAYGAASLFFEKTGIVNPGVKIYIEKNIPVGAGLAGGSADAAAILTALNDVFEAEIDTDELMKMGLALGADVPYCIFGGSALAEGKGELLRRLERMPECLVVIVKPPFSVSTASVFSKLDCSKIPHRPDTKGTLEALGAGDLRGICVRMYNVFEDVISQSHGEIKAINERLIDGGALGACMSGTGPSVFGIFSDKTLAKASFNDLKNDYNHTFLTKIV